MTTRDLHDSRTVSSSPTRSFRVWLFAILGLACLVSIYWEAVLSMIDNYRGAESYYSHGYLVPFVSAYFAWRKRDALRQLPARPSKLGFVVLGFSCLLVLCGDFLGLRVLGQGALVIAVLGLVLAIWGWAHAIALWFPIAFLLFMVPIPLSITQEIALRLKLFVLGATVKLTHLFGLPMVQDGSYIVFKDDRILIGEVCGGLRSLISLLALGAIMSYISSTPSWVRAILFLCSIPIALAANASRVFLLSMVGYVWGSQAAVGWIHDVSGVMIYAIAFILMLALERLFAGLTGTFAPRAKEAATS